MNTVEIVLEDLSFPGILEDKYCKFRLLISLRYKDSAGKTSYAREALPGLGKRDYWECEKDNKNKDNYVRHPTQPKLDTNKLDVTQRQVIFSDLDVKTLERLEVELFDIDIKVGWEKITQEILKRVPEVALPFINPTLPLTLTIIKDAIEKGTGKKVTDLEKKLIYKAIGKEDGAARSIWARSKDLTNSPEQSVTITGPGVQGNYTLTFRIEVS